MQPLITLTLTLIMEAITSDGETIRTEYTIRDPSLFSRFLWRLTYAHENLGAGNFRSCAVRLHSDTMIYGTKDISALMEYSELEETVRDLFDLCDGEDVRRSGWADALKTVRDLEMKDF